MSTKINSELEGVDDNFLEEPSDFKQESCCYAFWCAQSCKDRCSTGCKSIFERKPSALLPLDGMRAVAILWVFEVHQVQYT